MGSICISIACFLICFIIAIGCITTHENKGICLAWYVLTLAFAITASYLVANCVNEKLYEEEYLEEYVIQSITLQRQIDCADVLYKDYPKTLQNLYESAIDFNREVSGHQQKVSNWWNGSQHRDYWLKIPLVEFPTNTEEG